MSAAAGPCLYDPRPTRRATPASRREGPAECRKMPGIVPILRGPINTQYIPILAGLAERQSSNLFQYLQKSCSRIANIPFGGSTRPVICRSGRAKSLIDPIEPPTIAQECCAITQIRRNVRDWSDFLSLPPEKPMSVTPPIQSFQYLQGWPPAQSSNILSNTCRKGRQYSISILRGRQNNLSGNP